MQVTNLPTPARKKNGIFCFGMVLLLQYDLKNDLNMSPKKGNTKECSNYPNYRITTVISHGSKVMLKILQARLQQYMNREFPVQVGFRKGRGNRNQIVNIWMDHRKVKNS